jgi:IMP dehydrogenase
VRKYLQEMRLEKLPLVDKDWNILGLITARDFYHALNNPHTTHDAQRRLIVGAAIGVKSGDLDRALALCEAGVDCIVIDVAHGHSELAMNQVRELRRVLSGRGVDIVAGNVASGAGALALADCGADAIKVRGLVEMGAGWELRW